MGITLSTLRKYIRAEVGDPAPLEKLSALTLTHDGGNGAAFFQDQTHNFDSLGIVVGDVIRNTTDGGSLATIQMIGNGGATNDKLTVGSIEGGTDNDYDNGDVVEIYDRHAQKGLDGTRWTDDEVEDALAQSQKLVALRFGGLEKTDVHQDIIVQTLINCDNFVGTFVVGETVTGDGSSYTAVVEYVASDFLIISQPSGTFVDDETLTGGTSSATCDINQPSAYSTNNINIGQGIPTDLKDLIVARWWDGSQWHPILRDSIMELQAMPKTTGDVTRVAIWADRFWLWPNTGTQDNNALHLTYMAYDEALSSDTDTTKFDQSRERLTVLEAAKILAGGAQDNDLWTRIVSDIQLTNDDIRVAGEKSETKDVVQVVHWDYGFSDDGAFIP